MPFRNYVQNTRADYSSLYVGDTISLNRLTMNAALRLDRATDSVLAANVPAHPDLPDVLPGVDAPAVQERGRLEHLDAAHRRDLRARQQAQDAAARQLCGVCQPVERHDRQRGVGGGLCVCLLPGRRREPQSATSSSTSSVASSRSSASIRTNPLEVVNRIAPNLSSPRTHEVVAGIDHELMPNFGLSASYTWRRYNNVIWPLDAAAGGAT